MKKKITFHVLVATLTAVVLVRIGYTAFEVYAQTQSFVETQKTQMDWVLDSTMDLAEHESPERKVQRIADVLDGARLSLAVDFYQVEQSGQVVAKSKNITDMDSSVITPSVFMYTENEKHLLKKRSAADMTVVVGKNTDKKLWFRDFIIFNWQYLLMDISLLLIIISIVVRFRLEILTAISRVLSQLTPKDLENINHPSTEIRTIVNFLRSFIDEHFKSEQQRNLFKRNLADGILNELFTGKKKPPYPIQAVLVRFDMNNYSRRALQENTEQFTSLLSNYFRKVKELRIRYGGLDYQFIGDEKVLFFKIENPDQFEQQILRAVAFLRDSFSLAKAMSTDFPLTFKAAVVPGTLLFYELDGGHYFTGTPLIETARYLTTISEKDRSILSLSTVHNEKIKKLAKPFASETVLLKGYDSPLGISYFDRFDSIYSLEKEATLFLSDEGLSQILEQLTLAIEQKNVDRFFQIFQQIRGVRAEEIDPRVVVQFEAFLTKVVDNFKEVQIENKCLSCAVSLSWVFVPVGSETGKLKDLFYSLIRHKDVRVASNSLIASQRYEWNEDVIEKMLNSPSNRLRGDALVLLGRRGVDQKFFKAWKQLVENSDGSFVLSGLYASQEVFKFHVENNPTHLKSNPLVESMIVVIEKLVRNSKPNIVQRAQWALDAAKAA